MDDEYITPFTPEDVKLVKTNKTKNTTAFNIKKDYILKAFEATHSKDIHKISEFLNKSTDYGRVAKVLRRKEVVIDDFVVVVNEQKEDFVFLGRIEEDLWDLIFMELLKQKRTVEVKACLSFDEELFRKMCINYGFDDDFSAYDDKNSDNLEIVDSILENSNKLDEFINDYVLENAQNFNIQNFYDTRKANTGSINTGNEFTPIIFNLESKNTLTMDDIYDFYQKVPQVNDIYNRNLNTSDANFCATFIKQ